jgi:hypothetical protein
MERIPQSVALRVVFRAYLSSDGKTPATGKTIAITISKNGGAFANPAAGALNATETGFGFYYFDLGTADAGTLGPLAWRGAEGTINDAGDAYRVVSAHNAGFDSIPDSANGTATQSNVSAVGAAVVALGSPMQAGAHVQLATTQDQYAPAKAGDLMNLTVAYDAAKTAAAPGAAMALTPSERTTLAGVIFATVVETGVTFLQMMRLVGAFAAGKRSNAGTATEQYDAAGNPGTARIVGNMDASGNGTPTLTP